MDLLAKLSMCVERGKVNQNSPFPPDLKGQLGADELTKLALEESIPPKEILSDALIDGMRKIGVKFRDNKVFVPEVLMAAKAMGTAMEHLRPFFISGEIQKMGIMAIGTVTGDLHDIGKNLFGMMAEGAGWEIIDLGVDVSTEKFMAEIEKNTNVIIGLSALLTTTMVNMKKTTEAIKAKFPNTKVLIGGAPVTEDFCIEIGADFYASDPQVAIEYLNNLSK